MASLDAIFNHVVLPPRLPGKQDEDIDGISRDLTTRLLDACHALEAAAGDELRQGCGNLATMLQMSRLVNGEFVDKSSLVAAFNTITSSDQALVCYVTEQNAGLLIYQKTLKNGSLVVVFEAFEASPTTQTVLESPNALLWTFPDRAVQIPEEDFKDKQFQAALSVFLEKASSEHLSHLVSTATKAGTSIPEIRNPSSPALITHMLLSVFEAMGGPAAVVTLHKRVRDDVHLNGGEVPWRRLPFWLVLRVAAQRQLCLSHGADVGYVAYKLLMCMLYANLLGDCVQHKMHPSHVLLLQKKLGRKLAKLEAYLSRQVPADDEVSRIGDLFSGIATSLEKSIATARQYVGFEYISFKRTAIRRVPTLPRQVEDGALRLTLPSSGPYLMTLLQNQEAAHGGSSANTSSPSADLAFEGGIQKTLDFAQHTLDVSRQLNNAATIAPTWEDLKVLKMDHKEAIHICQKISKVIFCLVELAVPISSCEPVHASSALLNIFDLWAKMDAVALSAHPMLAEYEPLFPSDILNVLLLPSFSDMKRLRNLQRYIEHRFATCKFKSKTIFDNLDSTCFGTRFAANSSSLQLLYRDIRDKEAANRLEKELAWQAETAKYDQLSDEIQSETCSCTFDEDGKRDIRGCVRCFYWRKRNRMEIEVCENLLPDDDTLARAIVFELCVPECIAIYRSTTWEILTKLAYPKLPLGKGSPKVLSLSTKLCQFSHFIHGSSVTIASLSKSFSQTHYKAQKMKVSLSQVLLPFSSKFQLFDANSKLWISDFDQPPTLAHRCRVHIPKFLRDSVLPIQTHPPTYPEGPSSYETVASRPECPPKLSVHEFQAFQRLLSGRARRWFTILVELAGANLNFSKQDTVLVLSHLALEAGPSRDQDNPLSISADVEHQIILGAAHCALADMDFVQRLLEQLETRLTSIQANWRETNVMELLITMLLRVYSLVQDDVQCTHALTLLESARSTTLEWIDTLRHEIVTITDSKLAHQASMYAFQAALLCRRTFKVFAEDQCRSIGPDHLLCYVKASVALQQSLVVDVDALPDVEKYMLKRDIVMADELRDQVHTAIRTYPTSMNEGICYGIGLVLGHSVPTEGTEKNQFSQWEFHGDLNAGWVGSVVQPMGHDAVPQRIAFHYTGGHILIDGKTMGKLPDDIRDSKYVKELFRDQHLLTYPSSLQGMSHRLVAPMESQSIHFGRRGGMTIIVAQDSNGHVREFVPRHVFIDGNGVYDLPRGLVDDCTHWFKRTTKKMEICRASKWTAKMSDWIMDVTRRTVQRKLVKLVDPHSRIASVLKNIFSHFEDGQRLTVFQPLKKGGSLSVELRHLDLSFFVNYRGHLECWELYAEIDPNQDAGTLYGYRSMIVLRDCIDSTVRSIILPLGVLGSAVNGVHVNVWTNIDLGPRERNNAKSQAGKAYARFGIDNTLGRLTCPPEPRMLYTKALLHAFTSCDIPDPLTGRTGEEEAVHTLLSGRCQPWMPLTADYATNLFDQLKALAPNRKFYPLDKRVLQNVTWDPRLAPYMQNDRYGRLARRLLAKSENLSHFNDKPAQKQEQKAETDTQDGMERVLERRGEIQRRRFQCSPVDLEPDCPVVDEDVPYKSRGCVGTSSGAVFDQSQLVYQITKMLRSKTQQVPMAKNVSDILGQWPLIGGFGEPSNVSVMPVSSLMDRATVSDQWGGLVELSRQASPIDVMLTLAQLAFAPHVDKDVVYFLAAYSYLDDLSVLVPPSHASFAGFEFNKVPTEELLETFIAPTYIKFTHEPVQFKKGWKVARVEVDKKRKLHENRCVQDGLKLARFLLDQWPENPSPSTAGFTSDLIDVSEALAKIQPEWTRLLQNRDLSLYVAQLQDALATYRTLPKNDAQRKKKTSNSVLLGPRKMVPHVPAAIPSLSQDLVRRAMPSVLDAQREQQEHRISPGPHVADSGGRGPEGNQKAATYVPLPEYAELRQIISSFSASAEPMRQAYGADLDKSLAALENLDKQLRSRQVLSSEHVPTLADVSTQITQAKEELLLIWKDIQASLSSAQSVVGEGMGAGTAERRNWLKSVGLWPRLTPVSLLELLRSSSEHDFGPNVQECLVSYGCALTKLQRLQRMRRALQKKDRRRLTDELQNCGHSNWRPIDVPDWLLLEIDANLLIRPEQVDVARAIINPASKSNSVLQLNMGKGKTSVIVPMVIAVLANRQQMCRLVVPKALLLPTAQPVQSQLGGLVGRELRHIPFSRRLTSGANVEKVVGLFKAHHEELLHNRGVLLTAPEHILAFNLSGPQCLADGKLQVAREMISFQERLANGLCRDVLDESDFTLAVRTQLVYPSGQLTAVDGAPYRWKLVESLLSLVEDSLADLCAKFPHRIDTLPRPGGGFPMVYILQADIEDELHQRIVEGICNGHVLFFRPVPDKFDIKRTKTQRVRTPAEIQRLLEKALSDEGTDADIDLVAESFSDNQAVVNGLVLVRGLLRNSIVVTCLKKRWNVQYGLHPDRWPIAVPFEAKGVPSERSEFGHPDVSIIFTCLSFYYAGLTQEQFREGLQHILHHADDPATEYEQWTAGNAGTPLPSELRNWNAINVDDTGQVLALWRHLRFTRPVIDHYMNTFVFPVHSRQFSVKLQASAWDLPLFSLRSGEDADAAAQAQTVRQARTTGFSGTNDNKMMLPLTIKQEDLPGLCQTNAEVLTYLLQSRSRRYIRTGIHGHRWSENELLGDLKKNQIRVFIDAGAYVLERNNEALARAWLQEDWAAPGAVFFGEADNRAWVVFRNASICKTPLVATPFVDRLDECLVYFDEAHTRGVDLQLPANAKGALTLALGQTKDHTVQAAMRLRQLGSTQSVVFYAPPEVDQSIRDVCGQNGQAYDGIVESPHVISWLLEQTCRTNEQLQPLYTSHGMDFCRRVDAQWTHRKWATNNDECQSLLKILEQPERQTIQQLYGVSAPGTAAVAKRERFHLPVLQAFSVKLNAQRHSGQPALAISHGQASGAFEEVEQEREVEHQVEEVRLPQKKTKFRGYEFPGVCKAIQAFVQTGILSGGIGYQQVFAHIGKTQIGKRYGVQETESQLFVSTEFGRTIARRKNDQHSYDNFLRPVEWLLWAPSTETGIVVIPEELEQLLPILWTAESRVHLVAYAAPVTRAMITFSKLQFYALPALREEDTLPTWLGIEIGILAGRLYMSFEECKSMSEYLRRAVEAVGNATSLSAGGSGPSFCWDPVGFLLEWLPLLRATQDIMHTPAAYVCQGRILSVDHAFFARPGSKKETGALVHRSRHGGLDGGPDIGHSEDAGGSEWGEEYENEEYSFGELHNEEGEHGEDYEGEAGGVEYEHGASDMGTTGQEDLDVEDAGLQSTP